MRITLDTNVLLAAFIAEGLCQRVYSECLKGHELILSEFILEEIRLVFKRKARMPAVQILRNIESIRGNAEIIEIPVDVERVCRDANDDAVIATAVHGQAQVLVTGDQDLLILKKHRGVRIINPRTFIALL
ncbi:MAG: putative toxin-antitoxin system toxin component, PIN family [Spirochaetales bacterium]|nr:putative toxin-antitoxin system toxin component, PIN family [Spirochaetales bacterium]